MSEQKENGDAQVESTTEQNESMEKSEQADSTVKSEPIEQADSTEKSDSTEQEKPTEQAQSSVKTESSEPSDVELKIIKQIEYYFGDMNLPRDKFLQEQIKEDDGWVPLETMIKFNRLAQISTDIAVIAGAIKKSTNDLLEVHEDGTKTRRSPDNPLPDFTKERRDDLKLRTIYAKGFPIDLQLDQLLEFFGKSGSTEHIQMRRTKERDFKGSCFVVYHSQESAKKFLEGDETAKFNDTELTRCYKDDYYKRKMDEKKKEKLEDFQKRQEEREKREKKQVEEKKASVEERMTKGAVLHMSDIPNGTTREDIKEAFAEYGNVAWVEFDRGDKEGKLRFHDENAAIETHPKLTDGKITIKDTPVECRIVDGEEEVAYWKSVFQQLKERNQNKNRYGSGGRGRGRGGWGGRGGKRKFGGHRNDGGPRNKLARGGD